MFKRKPRSVSDLDNSFRAFVVELQRLEDERTAAAEAKHAQARSLEDEAQVDAQEAARARRVRGRMTDLLA